MSTKLAKGTAVVSLADGTKLGTIDHVYLDPRRKEIVGFSFHQGGLFGGKLAGVVDVGNVHAFGPDAVTIDDASAVRSELAIDARCDGLIDLEDLLKRGVITEGGTAVGQVAAVRFGQDSYRLTAIEVAGGLFQGTRVIAADQIAQIGAELIVVADAVVTGATGDASPPPALRHVHVVGPRRDEHRIAHAR
jgi:uncharacterized protein YrrD